MKKHRILILFAAALACCINPPAHSASVGVDAVIYDNNIDRSDFMKAFNSKPESPYLFLSDKTGDESDIAAKNFMGRDALFFKGRTKYAYGKAPEFIGAETKNAAVKITFYDRYCDYLRYTYTLKSGGGKNVLICKNGTNEWKTETILLDDSSFDGVMKYGSDFYINSYEPAPEHGNEYVSDVEFINLDTSAAEITPDGRKKYVLQQGTLELMSKMGFFEKNFDLAQTADMGKASAVFEQITGKKVKLNSGMTLREMIAAFSEALGYRCGSENDMLASGIVRSLKKHPQQWFGETSYKTQTHGFYDITAGTFDRPVCNDDLVGLCYNLLYIKINGESCLARLCDDESFFIRMTDTNDRNLVYTYYYEKGFRIREKTRKDELTGEIITEYCCPGTNVNIPYINELTTVDGENIVLVCGVDKQYNRGFPVVYNRKTGKTVTVDMNRTSMYSQVLSEQNVLWFTSGSKIYSYDIKTKKKELFWEEPSGCQLQEIPTITRDGRYLCVFWGTINKAQPNTIGILDTKTREMKTYLGQSWVDKNLYGPAPVFIGHVIINPVDPTIVQFLHGGGASVEDRMWFLDTKTGKTRKAPGMSRKFDGSFAEQCVHWVWSMDGKRLYYCRMTNAVGAKTGIVYYDFEKPENGVTVVDDNYAYAHAVPSPDGKLLVGDTHRTVTDGTYKSDIALYDSVSGFSRLLTYNSCWQNHPCHSHPVFSLDSSTVFFNTADKQTGFVRAASINIADTLSDMRKNGDVRHGKPVRAVLGSENRQDGIRVSNDPENNTPRYARVNGEDCRAIEYGMSLYCDTDGEYIRSSDKRVLLRITYFDNGTDPISLNYNTDKPSEVSRLKNYKSIMIMRKNTNKWVTKDILLTDASFRSAISTYDFSFNIGTENDAVCYIKEIEARALR